MDDKKNIALKSAMTYGLILGLTLIVLNLVQYIMDVYKPPIWVSLISYVLIVAVIAYGTIKFRDDELQGFISYGKAVGFGALLSLSGAIIYGFYFYILVYVIDPSYMDAIYNMLEETYLESGMSEDQVELIMNGVKKFQNPLFMTISSLFGTVFMGTLFSLITSIFIKKEKPLFDNTEA